MGFPSIRHETERALSLSLSLSLFLLQTHTLSLFFIIDIQLGNSHHGVKCNHLAVLLVCLCLRPVTMMLVTTRPDGIASFRVPNARVEDAPDVTRAHTHTQTCSVCWYASRVTLVLVPSRYQFRSTHKRLGAVRAIACACLCVRVCLPFLEKGTLKSAFLLLLLLLLRVVVVLGLVVILASNFPRDVRNFAHERQTNKSQRQWQEIVFPALHIVAVLQQSTRAHRSGEMDFSFQLTHTRKIGKHTFMQNPLL